MSRKSRTVVCCVLLLGIAVAASAFLITRAAPERSVTLQSMPQVSAPKGGPRNVFLQPEALRVARQLGKTFGATSKATSVLTGTLTISGAEQPLTMTRRQTETGEQVQMLIGSRTLTWTEQDGTNGYADVLDGNYHAMSTDWNAPLAIGGALEGFMSALGGLIDDIVAGTTESGTALRTTRT